ncbi:unnamed protein product [Polarella glacialis]|uniref:Uncharacterized protein n=1 Tax=Polarella glacialis TaxID=89957 RepID=A0A813DIN3_POLGL|nr:unnamed protein product [Polarella glacialis]
MWNALLQAFLEERVMVEATSVTQEPWKWQQHWCSQPPFSLKFFFRSWSRCERPEASQVIRDLSSLPDWQSAGTPGAPTRCTCNEPAVMWRASRMSDTSLFLSLVARGRFWWYAAMVRVLMEPLPWLQEDANSFFRASGLNRRPFVVAYIRRGNKSAEIPHIEQSEFTNQLKVLQERYGIADVLIQTEDERAVEELQQWCVRNRFQLHYTRNRRSGIDEFSSKFGPESGVNMTEEGRVAAVNLLIGSRGMAVLGSLHRAWLKVMPAFMTAHYWKAVLVVGLAGQNHWNSGSYLGSEASAHQLLQLGEVFKPLPSLDMAYVHHVRQAPVDILRTHPGLLST